ncbi:MAG TPA: divalent-cation tolerance protein CutA [archaeon]|nr:divalent-cation tolerance protein CutA [archaeon]
MSESIQEGHLVVFVTAASTEEAAALAKTLVKERLAACGNVVSGIRSIYHWQGRIEDQPEALVILKTRAELFEALKKRVLELHSYEVPEVIAMPVAAGHKVYLDWIDSSTQNEQH